ncbi:MAG: c-type cytochrome [Planctomycetes bacterium]|nr:c-type cytochrome [Planctomycetota bacterium]
MRFAVISFLSLVLTAPLAWAAEPERDSLERDYAAELPRIEPLSPAEAKESFETAPGFRIELAAAEPLVVDPVAMSFDENGRLFVIEMRDYSEQENEHLGRVRLLEDRDGDGRFDHSTVYADGLSWPTAIICWDGGVFVGAAPDIFYLKDTDGDNQADVRRVVFTGFGRSNVQGLLNTFVWGLDNRIHGATSSSGASVVPGDAPDAEPLVLRGRDFAFDPRTEKIEATSGGAQHGLSFDDWGNKFVCSNSDHIQAVMFEDRYVARNPYLAAPSPRVSIAADGPQADVFRASPVEPWRIVRTRLRAKGIVPGIVEGGGRPAGYFTGATGVTIYRGDAWPDEFAGWAVVGDVGSNLVHRKQIERKGLDFVARRVDEKSEFVRSSDVWFRPVQFANAPDGTLYVLDMYREVIEHPKSLPPIIKQHLDLTSGRDRGRIWRIAPEGFQSPRPPAMGEMTAAELVAALDDPNGWRRDTAARLLYQQQPRSTIPHLEKLARSAARPEGRIHAMNALDGLDAITAEVVLAALDDEHPHVRRHAVRLAERVVESPLVQERLYSLIEDPDIRVVYQLAFSLGELRGPKRNQALAAIVRRHPENRWMRVAAQSSLAEGAGDVLAELAADAKFRSTPAGRSWLSTLATQIGKQQRPADVAAVTDVLHKLAGDPSAKAALQTIIQALAARPGSPLAEQMAAATGGESEAVLRELFTSARDQVLNYQTDPEKRAELVHRLRWGELDEAAPVLTALLSPAQPADVQAAALATLASFPSPAVAALLVQRWPSLSPSLRSRAAEALFSRDAWIPALLEAVEQGRIAPGDPQPGRLKLLAAHPDSAIAAQARRVLEQTQTTGRGELLAKFRAALELEGDAAPGKAAFTKHCSKCHRLEGAGHELGPNLAAMQNRGPEAILTNVIDPNREVNPQYVTYVLITQDGRSLSGMISAETATSVTLRRAENAHDTVLRIDIDELRSTGQSLMPEGMEKEIDVQMMADLIAYIQSVE